MEEIYIDRVDHVRKQVKQIELSISTHSPSESIKKPIHDVDDNIETNRASFTLPGPRAPDLTHSVSKEIELQTQTVRRNSITDTVLKSTVRSALRSSVRSVTRSHVEGDAALPGIYQGEHGDELYINENNPQLNQDVNDDKIKLFKFESGTTITSSVGISPRSDYTPTTTNTPADNPTPHTDDNIRVTRYLSQTRPPPILRKILSEYDINDTPSSNICSYCSAIPILCFVTCISCAECKWCSKATNPDYNYNYKVAIKALKAQPRISR